MKMNVLNKVALVSALVILSGVSLANADDTATTTATTTPAATTATATTTTTTVTGTSPDKDSLTLKNDCRVMGSCDNKKEEEKPTTPETPMVNPEKPATPETPAIPTDKKDVIDEENMMTGAPIQKELNGKKYSIMNGSNILLPTRVLVDTKDYKTMFTDIDNSSSKEDIVRLEKAGIVKGTTPTTYEPNRAITRAEFLAIALNSYGYDVYTTAKNLPFTDVKAILNIYETNKIILAHHLDDKIETFFFNLVRGSKISGLINMQEKSGAILRPLLKIEKKDILEFLEKNNLEYKIDKTNFENEFSRNKIRNLIIPKFADINDSYKKNISNFIDYLGEIKELLDFQIKDFLNKFDGEYFLIDDFNSLPKILQKEVLRYLFFIKNNNSTIGLSSSNLDEIIKFINGKNNKTKKELKNLKLEKDNKKILY